MKDKVRCYVNNKPRQIIRSIIEKNGTRAVDTADITFPRGTILSKGDKVTYIQDVVSARSLTGIWNFFDNTRDEGGYDLDGSEAVGVEHDATFTDGCDGRVIFFQSGDTRGVRQASIDSTHIDFSGQFDVIIRCSIGTSNSASAGYLFAQGDTDDYIKISHTAVSSNQSFAKLEIKKNGSSPVVITGNTVNIYSAGNTKDASGYSFIRVKRDENGLVSLIVNGTTEGSSTLDGIINCNDQYLYFAADESGSNLMTGFIAQIRLYCGAYLTDEEYLNLRQTKRQPDTMKFGGIIWKIEESPTTKRVLCKGFAKLLHESEIDLSDTTVTFTNSGDIKKNVFINKTGAEIVTELISVFEAGITDPEDRMKVVDVDNKMNFAYKKYTAKGTIFSNLLICLINSASDSSFYVSPRKILRLEENDIDYFSRVASLNPDGSIASYPTDKFAPVVFKQGVIRVNDLGYDDTNTVTFVTAVGNIQEREKVETRTYSWFSSFTENSQTVWQLSGNTLNGLSKNGFKMKVTSPSGIILNEVYSDTTPSTDEFRAEYNDRNLVLGNRESSGDYTIEYQYEDIGLSTYKTESGGDSGSLGRLHKVIFVPQITDAGGTLNINNFATRYISRFGTLNRRFSIMAPTLLNNIRENFKVKVIDETHVEDGTTSINNLSIKSIIWYYPEGLTSVNLGDNVLDSYDIDNALGNKTAELRASLTKTQPS